MGYEEFYSPTCQLQYYSGNCCSPSSEFLGLKFKGEIKKKNSFVEVSLSDQSEFRDNKILHVHALLEVLNPPTNTPTQWVRASVYSFTPLPSGHMRLTQETNAMCEWFPIDSPAYHFITFPYVYCLAGYYILNTHLDSQQRRAVMLP